MAIVVQEPCECFVLVYKCNTGFFFIRERVVQISIVDVNSSGSTLRSRISFFFSRSFAWNGALSRSILWLVNLSFPSFPPFKLRIVFDVGIDKDIFRRRCGRDNEEAIVSQCKY